MEFIIASIVLFLLWTLHKKVDVALCMITAIVEATDVDEEELKKYLSQAGLKWNDGEEKEEEDE